LIDQQSWNETANHHQLVEKVAELRGDVKASCTDALDL
jgi:hypothetical protein